MFQKIKELEDLKVEYSKLQAENSIKEKELKRQIIKEVTSGFINLFNENGFTINNGESSRYVDGDAYQITASYQSAQFVLNVPSEDSGVFGAISRFEFMFKGRKWIIVATEKGNENAGFRVVIQDNDELVQLKKDIDDAKKYQLKLNSPFEYSLIYYIDGNKDNKKVNTSIKHVLQDILGEK